MGVTFSEVQHQERAVGLIRHALRAGRLPHALLFDGPEGVGKELTARALAAALLCEAPGRAPDADACGKCQACVLLAADTHPDYQLIHRGMNKQHPDKAVQRTKGLFLTVDLIRHFLLSPATWTPAMGRARLFIIRDAEKMNEGAQNALLKTLEEPPAATRIILLSASADRLLATIRSRCQRFSFDFLPVEFVRTKLTHDAVPARDAGPLAALSQGRLGAARLWARAGLLERLPDVWQAGELALRGDPEGFGKRLVQSAIELSQRLFVKPDDEAANESVVDEPDDDSDDEESSKEKEKKIETDQLRDSLRLLFLLLAGWLRDNLVTRGGAAPLRQLPVNAAADAALQARSADDLNDAISAVGEAERMLERNVAPQMACEWLAAALCGDLVRR